MKNNSVKSGFGAGFLIFAVAATIALPMRTAQFFTVLEGGTGFYEKIDWNVRFLFAVLLAATAALLAVGVSSRKRFAYSFEVKKRPVLAAASFLAAFGALYDAANNAVSVLKSSGTADADAGSSADAILIAEAVFAAFSAVYFLAFGACCALGKSADSKFRLISLSPTLWSIFRTAFRFTRTISYLRVSDLALETTAFAFMILFFMAFAQVNSRINADKIEWKIAAYGLPAALLSLLCFVPRFIVTIIGRSELLYAYSPPEPCDFFSAVFILAVVASRIADKTPEKASGTADKDGEKVGAEE